MQNNPYDDEFVYHPRISKPDYTNTSPRRASAPVNQASAEKQSEERRAPVAANQQRRQPTQGNRQPASNQRSQQRSSNNNGGQKKVTISKNPVVRFFTVSKGRRMKPKAILKKRIIPCAAILAILLLVIIIGAAIGSSSGKADVTAITITGTESIEKTMTVMNSVLIQDDDNLFIAFIDNDYSAHGIKKSITVNITNPEDASTPIEGYVWKIEELEYNSDALNTLVESLGIELEEEESQTVIAIKPLSSDTENFPIANGEKATVEIELEKNSSAFCVPDNAIVTVGGDKYIVKVNKKNKVEIVPVETGIDNAVKSEITSGLAKGDRVVISAVGTDISTLENGMKVKVTEATTSTDAGNS